MRRTLLLCLLLLAGCGPGPYADCVTLARAELETLDMLIAEAEANLLRGYALQPDPSQSDGFRFCAGGEGPLSLCAERTKAGEKKPVAIDPLTERMKLANLRERRVGVEELARREVAQCEALYGRRR